MKTRYLVSKMDTCTVYFCWAFGICGWQIFQPEISYAISEDIFQETISCFGYQGLLPWFYISLSCVKKHEFIHTTYFCVLVQKCKNKTILSSSETQVVRIPQICWTFKTKMVCICYHTFPVSQPLQVDQHLDHLLEWFLPHLFQPKQKITSGNSDKQHQRSINTPK